MPFLRMNITFNDMTFLSHDDWVKRYANEAWIRDIGMWSIECMLQKKYELWFC